MPIGPPHPTLVRLTFDYKAFARCPKVDYRIPWQRKDVPNPAQTASAEHFLAWLNQEKARKAGDSRRIREEFSELQTEWRWMQSRANPSLGEIPVNREKYREFRSA